MNSRDLSPGGAAGGGEIECLERRVLLAAVVLNNATGLTLDDSYGGRIRVSNVDGGFDVADAGADDLERARVPVTIEFTDVTADRRDVEGVMDAGALGVYDVDGSINRRRLRLTLDGDDASGVLIARLRGGGDLLRGNLVLTDADGDELQGRLTTRADDAGTAGAAGGLNRFGQGVNINALRRFGFGNGIDTASASRFGFGSGVGVSSSLFNGQRLVSGVGDTTDAIVMRDDGLLTSTFNGVQIGSVFDL
jgi:hypothetical protein